MKEIWKTEVYREKFKLGIQKFVDENGYYPGTDENSKQKRIDTMYKKYGIYHNWSGNYGERLCDKTTIKKYGIGAAEMLSNYTHHFNRKTNIEIIFEKLLTELNIPYLIKYRIYNKTKTPFWFKEYDFLLKDFNVLIEVDGDYWHGNTEKFKQLSEFQLSVRENDRLKEEFAKLNGYEVIRFWETTILTDINYIKNKLNQYVKN